MAGYWSGAADYSCTRRDSVEMVTISIVCSSSNSPFSLGHEKVGGPGGGSMARRRLLVAGWGTSHEDRLGHGPAHSDASR